MIFRTVNEILESGKKYSVIYADPPWQYDDKSISHGGGADSHYATMTVEDICALPVQHMISDNSILFIWGTWTHIREIQDVIKAWGFEYKTVGFVWVKEYTNGRNYVGMGRWTRANTEYCLIATHGAPKRINNSVSQLIKTIPKQHSSKPDVTRPKIRQLMGDLPGIELFGRKPVLGWDVFGNDDRLDAQPLEVFDIKSAKTGIKGDIKEGIKGFI